MRIPLRAVRLRLRLPECALQARGEERHGRLGGGLDRGGCLLRALGHHLLRVRVGVGVGVRVGVRVGVGVRVKG